MAISCMPNPIVLQVDLLTFKKTVSEGDLFHRSNSVETACLRLYTNYMLLPEWGILNFVSTQRNGPGSRANGTSFTKTRNE